jgi:hypothetical protein
VKVSAQLAALVGWLVGSISLQFLTLKMGQTASPETLAFNLNLTPGNYPKEDNLNMVYVASIFYTFLIQNSASLHNDQEKQCNSGPSVATVVTSVTLLCIKQLSLL